MRVIVNAVLATAFILSVANVYADSKADAKRHFESGLALMNAEDFAGAVTEFEESVSLYPTKGAVFNLANCYKALSRYSDALAALDTLEREFGKSLGAEMRRAAAAMRKEIQTIVCTLKVRVKKPGASVFVDGTLVGKSPLPITAMLGPGEHEVRVELTGMPPVMQAVKLVSGDTRELEFALDGTDATSVSPMGTQQPFPPGQSPQQGTAYGQPPGPAFQGGTYCQTSRDCRYSTVCFNQQCMKKFERWKIQNPEMPYKLRIGIGSFFTAGGGACLLAAVIGGALTKTAMEGEWERGEALLLWLPSLGAGLISLSIGLPILLKGLKLRREYRKQAALSDHFRIGATVSATSSNGILALGGVF